MTPNRTIYVINQAAKLLKMWRELSEIQKRAVIKDCEMAEESNVEELSRKLQMGKEDYFDYRFQTLFNGVINSGKLVSGIFTLLLTA